MSELYELSLYVTALVFVIPIIIFVNKKLYWNIKNEEHLENGRVIQSIIKTYALVQCVTWPCIILAYGLIKLIGQYWETFPLKTTISVFRFLYTLFRDYLQFHSLIIAICRYIFTIYNSEAARINIQTLRSLLIYSSISVPFLSTVLYELTCPIEKTYLHWFSVEEWSQKRLNLTEGTQIDRINAKWESEIFIIFNKYMPSALLGAFSIIDQLLFSIIYSNFIEGCN